MENSPNTENKLKAPNNWVVAPDHIIPLRNIDDAQHNDHYKHQPDHSHKHNCGALKDRQIKLENVRGYAWLW